MKKPILVLTLGYPPQLGGIQEYVRGLLEACPHDRVRVLAPRHANAHTVDMHSDISVYRHNLLNRFVRPRWLPLMFWADRLCKKERPGVVVVSNLLPAGYAALWQKQKRGIPYVVILHGMDVAVAATGSKRKRQGGRSILRNAALVIANSSYTAGLAENFGVEKRDIMILSPSPSFSLETTVEPSSSAAVRNAHGIGDDFMVLSVGRLVRRKGFDDCIRAIAALKTQGVLVRYLLVGEGQDKQRLEALAKDLQADDLVRLCGAVPPEELPTLYAACDVFAMPSKAFGPDVEGFGTVFLEANLLGKPVIGARSGGIPDAVKDGVTGVLVDPGDTQALAQVIRQLKEDPARAKKLGEQGRERVLSEFGWQRLGRRFMAAIDELT